MNYDYIYDSSIRNLEVEVKIDYENLVPVTVLFEKENITLTADALGNAVFQNAEGDEIFKDKAEGKKRYFSSIYVSVKDSKICVRFPITETIDHYPNCDGEYDRYSERIVDNVCICCSI